ncbi:hypothetical protein LTR56_009632 [Elasticomyces elasticus]|nr:hypothetical protein LTR56_009632 [Elasticomyces elasticus]KAK3660132.1 hypothetical protein LTR22_008139 [Elasticomyces elasticus]KAK5752309.1 hypothetical protein LTS12_017610 [Elasticomyces elasticus]
MSRRLSALFTSSDDSNKPLPMAPSSSSPASQRRQSPPGAHSRSPAPGRLHKPAPAAAGHSRAASADFNRREPSLPILQEPSLASLQYGGAPSPLLPPPPIASGTYSRSSSVDRSRPSTPNYSRPATPTLQINGQSPITPSSPMGAGTGSAEKKEKKKHGLFGRSKKDEQGERGPPAWIAGEKRPYDHEGLMSGRPMQEMWDETENGNCYIYLFPRGDAGKGASFKVDSAIFAASPVLTRLAFGDAVAGRQQMQNLSINDRTNTMSSADSRSRYSDTTDTTPTDTHLYLPIKLSSPADVAQTPVTPSKPSKNFASVDTAAEDLQTLIDIRNFFSFLLGGPLVATERKGSWFQIFMSIAGVLKTYEFTNLDGSTFGDIANSSFDEYVRELALADVRTSREMTIEGVVLGERMKSVLLYNEAFTHAVGKLDDLIGLKSPKYALISPLTQNRLTRASMDLEKRIASTQLILQDFELPSLFSGIMNSRMSEERKEGVRFEAWKDGFMGMRKWTMHTYQQRYGNWPPKAKSKKNDLETSGLSRAVLRDVYHDMCGVYNLMADRSSLTTRTVDGVDTSRKDQEEATTRGLRAVLSEYDRSSPPVKPPVPFDLPVLPHLRMTRTDFGTDKKKDLKAIQKRLKDDEIAQLLRYASHGADVNKTPFMDSFFEMERKAAHHCNIAELVDLRIGQWIFMYVVLQALPLLVVDAPGISFTKGVEYFLCEPPRSGVPWATPNAAAGSGIGGRHNAWFAVGDGGGVVSLPSDIVQHSVEGVYRRSHCWVMAEKWSSANPILNSALHEQSAINAEQSAALGDGILPADPAGAPPAGDVPRVSLGEFAVSSPAGPDSRPVSRGLAPGSPMRNNKRLSSINIGLEALPLPPGVVPDGRSPSPGPDGRPSSRAGSMHHVDSNKTFEAILAEVPGQKKGKKKW